jgi:nucleotide-binding universal stress UspA family protein
MQTSIAESVDVHALVSPQSILLATDRTDMDLLLPYAVAQAKASHALLTVVSAITPGDNAPVDSPSPYIDMVRVRKDIMDELEQQAAAVEAQGVPCQVYVECGTAVDVICGQLRKTRAQRLVMGTHGRGRLGRLTLGSVAGELLRVVQIPVFAVGPKARAGRSHEAPGRILHPVSLEGDYERGVQFAMELAMASHAQLTLLLVLNRNDKTDVNPERSLEWGRTALRSLIPKAIAKQLNAGVEAVFGRVPEEICAMAEKIAADLIVIGVSGTILFSPLAENTAYNVLARAECPVLTAPHQVREPVRESDGELTGALVESGY